MAISTPVLRLSPGDADVIQSKLFLLLQTSQYATALKFIEEMKRSSELQFERAYVLYRLQKEQEATALVGELKGKSENERGLLHLEAQLVRFIALKAERNYA